MRVDGGAGHVRITQVECRTGRRRASDGGDAAAGIGCRRERVGDDRILHTVHLYDDRVRNVGEDRRRDRSLGRCRPGGEVHRGHQSGRDRNGGGSRDSDRNRKKSRGRQEPPNRTARRPARQETRLIIRAMQTLEQAGKVYGASPAGDN